jgi:signal transduction histidine kinase
MKKWTFSAAIFVPFTGSILITTGLAVFLAYQNQLRLTRTLTLEVGRQVGSRVVDRLHEFTDNAKRLNRLHHNLYRNGLVDLNDQEVMGRLFHQQMTLHPEIGYLAYTDIAGHNIGVERKQNNQLVLDEISIGGADQFDRIYNVTSLGERIQQIDILKDWDPRQEESFMASIKAAKPIWSRVYQWQDQPNVMSVSTNMPARSKETNQIIGVFSIDLILTQMSTYLASLDLPDGARVLITDSDGIVALSTDEKPLLLINKTAVRKPANKSEDPVIRELYRQLANNNSTSTDKEQHGLTNEISIQNNKYIAFVERLVDPMGLNWQISIAMPEKYYLGLISDSTRNTLITSLIIMTMANLLGIATMRMLTNPIKQLSDAADLMSRGDLEQRLPEHPIKELDDLSGSFNTMANKLLTLYGDLQSKIVAMQAKEEALIEAKTGAEVANRAKSTFLANMSHELRTPLNAIIGYGEMVEEELTDTGKKDLAMDVVKIRTSGKHLLSILNDVLDLSKIEAGKMELFIEQFSVRSMLNDLDATIKPVIAKNRNTLVVNVSATIDTMISDAGKLRQSLINLLGNAAKFSKESDIQLDVRHEPGNNGSSEIIFQVTDHGIGMSEEQLSKLFQAFVQADASTTRKYGGTGLGLAITQRFCQLMGGSIEVESAPGVGSRFTIRLPQEVSIPEPRTS